MKNRSVAVIVRVSSRKGQAALQRVPALLEERGLQVLELFTVDRHKALCKAAKRAVRGEIPTIVVCGGDGTLTSIVSYFAKRDVTLGVVPSGTVNSFSRNLGIDQTFEGAADVIAFGVERRIDVARVNGTYFANFLTVGLEADAAKRATRGLKKSLGPLAYGAAALSPFLAHKPFRCKLRAGERRMSLETQHVIVLNGKYYGYEPIDPGATQTDEQLHVFVDSATGRLGLMQTYLALLRGTARTLPGAHLFTTREPLRLRAQPKQYVSVDGRPLGKTPICVEVVPAALRVMTAKQADGV
jgi:YegS/Rv2252/BmrU family lipid kinase